MTSYDVRKNSSADITDIVFSEKVRKGKSRYC